MFMYNVVQCFFLNKSTIFRQTHISYKYGYPDFQTHPYILSIVDFGKAFSTPKPFWSLPVPSCSPGPPGPPCMLSVPRSDVPKSLVITCSAGIWRTWIPALFVSWSYPQTPCVAQTLTLRMSCCRIYDRRDCRKYCVYAVFSSLGFKVFRA